MTYKVVSAVSNLLGNTPLEKAMYGAMTRLGPIQWDDADRALAEKFQATLTAGGHHLRLPPRRHAGEAQHAPFRRDRPARRQGRPDDGLHRRRRRLLGRPHRPGARGHLRHRHPGHSWQLTAQSKSSIGDKGLIHVAKIMAATAVEAIKNPELIAAAKADYAARTERNPTSARSRPT
jgi:aminobenzoyl-glutamate utilization protein B